VVALVFLAPVFLMPATAQGQDTVAVESRTAEIAAEPLAVRYRALAFGMVSAATWTQALGVPEGWDRTWQGYGNRLGDQLGFGVSEEVLRLGLEHATHWRAVTPACESARPGRPFVARFGAATRCGMSSTFVAQNRAGERRPNAPLLGAIVAASALSLTWRPERKTAHKGQLFMITRVGIVTGATVFNRGLKAMRKR
jgi:hypothetical protein